MANKQFWLRFALDRETFNKERGEGFVPLFGPGINAMNDPTRRVKFDKQDEAAMVASF